MTGGVMDAIERFLFAAMDEFIEELHTQTYPLTVIQRLRVLNKTGTLPPRCEEPTDDR